MADIGARYLRLTKADRADLAVIRRCLSEKIKLARIVPPNFRELFERRTRRAKQAEANLRRRLGHEVTRQVICGAAAQELVS